MSVLYVDKENFNQVVLQGQGKVLVDFWATWCGPCMKIAPEIEALAEENEHLTVCKLNVDEATEVAITYGVTSIPTVLVFENGDQVQRIVGFHTKEQLLKKL